MEPPAAADLQSLLEYLTRPRPPKAIPELVQEFLGQKESDGFSPYRLRDLEGTLGRFAADAWAGQGVPLLIGELTVHHVRGWLDAQEVGALTWNNYRERLSQLLQFATRGGHIAQAPLPPPKKVRGGPVGIFTPQEMRRLLATAPEEMLPLLLLGGFAGLRTEEIRRLQWDHVKLPHKLIFLPRQIIKTFRTRAVPISENLGEWLKRFSIKGPVCPVANPWNAKERLAKAAGLEWKRNALRHSYGSYRLALIQDLAQVSLEMGNSPIQVQDHYLELVTPADATEWFGLWPSVRPQEILALDFAPRPLARYSTAELWAELRSRGLLEMPPAMKALPAPRE